MFFQVLLLSQRIVQFIGEKILFLQLVIDDIRLIELLGMEVVQNRSNWQNNVQKPNAKFNDRANMPGTSDQIIKYHLTCRFEDKNEFHQEKCTCAKIS